MKSSEKLTFILLNATLASEMKRVPKTTKWREKTLTKERSERVVKTLLGVNSPPTDTKTESTVNMITGREMVK